MITASSNESIKTRSSSGHSSDQSIINRKIERRGIPSSFSANLSNRTSPPRSATPAAGAALPTDGSRDAKSTGAAQRSGGNTSVRAIVAWLESSTRDEAQSLTSISSDSRSKSSLAASTLSRHATATPPANPPQTLPMAPDVEEYSLTLLNYREYFTEKPLGRCLDKKPEVTTVFSVKRINNDDNDDRSPRYQDQNAFTGLKTSSGNNARLDKPMFRRNSSQTASPPGINDDGHQRNDDAPPTPPCRNPAEAEAFWTAVRAFLRISNEELEQAGDTEQLFESRPVTPPEDAAGSPPYSLSDEWSLISVHEASPHRRGQSEPSVSPVRNRRRKRFLSVEEKMLEIDDFLGTT